MSLDELRSQIDQLDEQLVKMLNDRVQVAFEIGKLKTANQSEIYVPAREKEVLQSVVQMNEGPLKDDMLKAIYREIMSASISLEQDVQIAYLGPPATFTHQAARSRFGGSVEYKPCETISDVFLSVENRLAQYGVVPIENSTEGAVTHTLDQFINTPVKICSEIFLPISHHLLANEPKENLKRVYSNPQVFGQCRRWLHANLSGVELIPVSSTAKAAEMVTEEKGSGALAALLAAEIYGLDALVRDIQDLGGNTTRFLVIAKSYGRPTGQDKTSIVFSVKHQVGALFEALASFRKYSINMSKIESRPSKEKAWEYYFFVDVEGHAEDDEVKQALSDLSVHCSKLTILGSYPNATRTDH